MDDRTKYLLNIAMGSHSYCEALKKDENKASMALGYLFRMYPNMIKDLSSKEIVLLITFLSDINEDYYDFYYDLFANVLNIAVKKDSIIEQYNFLCYIEDIYYLFDDINVVKVVNNESI